MEPDSSRILTTIILATAIFGLFILSATLRIRKSWKAVHNAGKSKGYKAIKVLDLLFSGIFLVASIVFYSIFVINIGQ